MNSAHETAMAPGWWRSPPSFLEQVSREGDAGAGQPGEPADEPPDGEPAGNGGIGDHVVRWPLHPPRDVRIGPVVPTLPVEQRGERRAALPGAGGGPLQPPAGLHAEPR